MTHRRPRSPEEIEVLRRRIAEFGFWYHNIDFGDGVLANPNHPHGDHPADRWRLVERFVPEDCSGSNVLDLGCNAGYFCLEFKKRGADYSESTKSLPPSNRPVLLQASSATPTSTIAA